MVYEISYRDHKGFNTSFCSSQDHWVPMLFNFCISLHLGMCIALIVPLQIFVN